MIMNFKIKKDNVIDIQRVFPFQYFIVRYAYSFDCTFYKFICLQDVGKEREQERKLCLTAKALHIVTGFCSSALASCVTLPPASMQSCKTIVPYVLYITMCGFLVGTIELIKRTFKRVSAMDGVYAAFAWSKKAAQLRFPG